MKMYRYLLIFNYFYIDVQNVITMLLLVHSRLAYFFGTFFLYRWHYLLVCCNTTMHVQHYPRKEVRTNTTRNKLLTQM